MPFTKFQYTNNASQVVDFLMSPSTSGGYIGITGWDPELVDEGDERSRMESNNSWPTYNYAVRLLMPIQADMLCQSSSDFEALKIATIQKLMPAPDVAQTDRTHGTLTIHPESEAHDLEIPVQVKSFPKFTQEGISPCGATLTVTFLAFRPYWHRLVADDYIWYV